MAEKRLKTWLEDLDRVAWGEKPRRSFDDLAVAFIDKHLPRLKPKSAERYIVSIQALTDTFEGVPLDKITSSKLSEFEDARRRQGWRIPENMIGKKRPRPLQPSTIRRDLNCLSSMFGFAIEIEWTEVNPVSAYLKRGRRRGLREAPPRRRYLTIDEERKLLAAARDQWAGRDLHEAIALAIDTGLRRGELFALERDRVELDRNRVRLFNGTKNARPRDVPLLPRAHAILAQKPAQMLSRFIFINRETGQPYRHMNRGLAGAAKRAGIARLTWHDLRRTCGCRLLQEHHFKMEEVSRWLGHGSITVTERAYAFLEEEHLQRAIAAGTKPGTRAAENL